MQTPPRVTQPPVKGSVAPVADGHQVVALVVFSSIKIPLGNHMMAFNSPRDRVVA
jgi:hypothetical protein